MADELVRTAQEQYKKEEIGYFEFVKAVSAGLKIKLEYIETVKKYNQTAIQLEFYAD